MRQYPDPSDQLREILKAWLRTSGQQTWQTIADALKSRIVGEPTLASNIEAKYCQGTPGQASRKPRYTHERIHNVQQQVRASQESQQQIQQQLQELKQQLTKQPSAQPQANPPQQEATLRKLTWRDGPKAPQAMTRGSVATDGTTVYCNDWKSTRVHQFHSDSQQWSTLPNLPHLWSTLVMADGKLTSVGGHRARFVLFGESTDSLLSLTGEGRDRKWLLHFPSMPTKRYAAAAICHGRSLIVAGGRDGRSILATVEVLNMDSRLWAIASSLPPPFSRATASICGERLYLLGGYNQTEWTRSVLTCSIFELLHSCQTLRQSTIWQRISDAPYKGSSCATLCGQLVVVGGDDKANKDTTVVSAYDESTNSWLAMEAIKTPRWCPLVASLHENTLMVVGGYHGRRLDTVEIAKVS